MDCSPGSERHDSRRRSVSVASPHSSHRSRGTTPNTQSPASSASGASPHTPQRPFQRSPAPEPSDHQVRRCSPGCKPLPQSPLHSRAGTHDPASFPRHSSPLAESGSSNSHQLVPPFCLGPAAEIHERAPKTVDRSRALSASSSVSPAGYLTPSTPHPVIARPPIQSSGSGVRQPSQGPRARAMSSGAASHYNAAAMLPSVYQQESSLLHDVVLMTAISAGNAEHREFPWYCVWTRALEKHTFPSTIGESLICNLAPQHVLVRSFDPSPPDSQPFVMDRDMSPRTPPRRTHPAIKKSHVIPDFAQILRRIRLPLSVPPVIERERVIFFAEIKPKRFQEARQFQFDSVNTQISRQACYAFSADSTLTIIGAIIAFGNHWKYVEIPRPPNNISSNWSEFRDPTFGSQSNTRVKMRVPTYLQQLSGREDMSFDLMDPQGLSVTALKYIASRILEREKNI